LEAVGEGGGWLSKSARQRNQRIFNRIVLVTILVITVIITAIAFSRHTYVVLPSYLDRCIPLTGPFVYDSVPQLRIDINGANMTIPANIGIVGNCVRPIHTFTATGAIHIDTDVDRTYTLGDFFLVWGNTFGTQYSTFSRNQIFGFRTDSNHTISMVVNNQTDTTDFENLIFPKNANSTFPFQVAIVYR